jgi:cellulose 1,4-beta-cellobiosidase
MQRPDFQSEKPNFDSHATPLYTVMLALCPSFYALPSRSTATNPFAGVEFYVPQALVREIHVDPAALRATAKGSETLHMLEAVADGPSAYWIDKKEKIGHPGDSRKDTLHGILRDAARQPSSPLVVVILYDLPNRDCHAKASNGEICCAYLTDRSCDYMSPMGCSEGLREYQEEYVDPFAAALAMPRYRNVPVVVVLEPDSLPNLATNLENPRCGNSATRQAYEQGVTYAIETLARVAPHAALYQVIS